MKTTTTATTTTTNEQLHIAKMARDVIEINLTRLTLCLITGLRSGVTVLKVSTYPCTPLPPRSLLVSPASSFAICCCLFMAIAALFHNLHRARRSHLIWASVRRVAMFPFPFIHFEYSSFQVRRRRRRRRRLYCAGLSPSCHLAMLPCCQHKPCL